MRDQSSLGITPSRTYSSPMPNLKRMRPATGSGRLEGQGADSVAASAMPGPSTRSMKRPNSQRSMLKDKALVATMAANRIRGRSARRSHAAGAGRARTSASAIA
jgi:hypothetical protein